MYAILKARSRESVQRLAGSTPSSGTATKQCAGAHRRGSPGERAPSPQPQHAAPPQPPPSTWGRSHTRRCLGAPPGGRGRPTRPGEGRAGPASPLSAPESGPAPPAAAGGAAGGPRAAVRRGAARHSPCRRRRPRGPGVRAAWAPAPRRWRSRAARRRAGCGR